jgi:hypothetical protein
MSIPQTIEHLHAPFIRNRSPSRTMTVTISTKTMSKLITRQIAKRPQ